MTVQPAQMWLRPLSQPDAREQPVPQLTPAAAPVFDLSEVARAIWRRKLPLALWLATCLALAAWYLAVTPITFTAAAAVILEPRQPVGPPPTVPQTVAAQALDVAQAESQIQVIRGERILSTVFDVLALQDAPELAEPAPGLRERLLRAAGLTDTETANAADRRARTFQAFSDRVGVRRLGQSYVVEVSYQAGSAEQAARVSNAIAVQYIKAQIDVKAAAATQGTEYLRGRIINIEAEQQAAFEGVRDGRIPDMLFSDADARIIGAALRPLNKSYPKGGLIFAFALTFGLVTGLLAIAARQALDRTLNTRGQIRAALGVDCLGILPKVARSRDLPRSGTLPLARLATTRPTSPFMLGLRSVRAAIMLAVPAERRWAVGVASWADGEGRSTVAVNLAHLLSVSNDTVELIDADLRNPTLTAALAPDAPEGLNDVLLAREGEEPLASLALSSKLGFVPAMAAGVVPEPNLYLGFGQMRALLTRLRATRNVVIDLPPLTTGSDAQALSPYLDGIVLVVEAGQTTIEEAAEAIQVLRAAHGRVLGVVLNKAKPERARRRLG